MLVHAWGESGRSFNRLIKLLPATFAPLAINLPGDSSPLGDANGYSVKNLASYLASVLDTLNTSATGSDRAVVLGSSSGGYLAQQLAVDHPEMLDALILVGSPISLVGRPVFADEVEHLTDPVDTDWVREFFTWFPRHHPVPADYIDERIRDASAIPAQVWRDSLVGLCEATPPLETGHITTPTLVIGGKNDNLLGSAHLDLVTAIPNARGVEYEDTGHLVLWERPERIAADLAAFVHTLPSSP